MFRRLQRDYLSLTRGERGGMQVLVFLVLVLVVCRFFIPDLIRPGETEISYARDDFIAYMDSLRDAGIHAGLDGVKNSQSAQDAGKIQYFLFDPNTVVLDSLVRLGVDPRTARTLINYREAGGRFAADSDLLKIYGMKPDVFRRILPYIKIATLPEDVISREPENSNQEVPGRFELNSADSLELISIYGIGPVFARRIIRYRELLGGFCCFPQLMEVYGFTPRQYDELKRHSFIDTALIRKMDLNKLDKQEFAVHPYLNYYQAGAIVAFRELMGDFSSLEQVLENRLLPDSVFMRILPYLYIPG